MVCLLKIPVLHDCEAAVKDRSKNKNSASGGRALWPAPGLVNIPVAFDPPLAVVVAEAPPLPPEIAMLAVDALALGDCTLQGVAAFAGQNFSRVQIDRTVAIAKVVEQILTHK